MASRKEYEMLFQLNAQLGGSYNSAFKSAQNTIASMQKEIAALSKTQSDISAYQKQQGAVDATKKKLEILKEQYDNIQKEMSETGEFSSTLANKLLAKQQQIDKTTASLGQQTQKLDEMGAALNRAGVDTSNLSQESEKLRQKMEEAKKKQEEAADGANKFGSTASAAFGAVGQAIVSAGIAAALKEIYEAYMECVNIAGDFEASMSNVEALSGANTDEMAKLSAQAKELGATTKFTAQESADAMGYMAMAGWGVNDMLQGMDGVLQLAAASGEDLALVSDIVTDSMSAFGLKAHETGRYADVLAAAATNSNTNVAIMGETFKMSASVAGALGYSVEDVAVAVGLMANSGVKGSIAGTALKNTFNGLLEGVTLTAGAFGEYEYSAIKADGTMKDFGATIDELRVYFNQMTEAERVNNAMTLAGQRGYNGLLAILNATEDDYNSLTVAINESSGAAAKMASIKLDNMKGEATLAASAWEALTVSVGEQFTPAMSDLYQVAAKVFSELSQFVQRNPALVKAIGAFVAVIGAAVAALTTFMTVTKVLIPLMKLLTASIPGVNIIMGVVTAVAALTAVFVALTNAGTEEERMVRSLTSSSREQYHQLQELTAEYETAKEVYGETSEEALLLRYEVDQLTAAFEGSKKTLEQFVAETDALIEAHDSLIASYSQTTSEISSEEQGTLALVAKLQQLSEQTSLTAGEHEQMKAIISELNETVPDLALNYDSVTKSLNMSAQAVQEMVKAQADQERQAENYRTWVELTKEEVALREQLADAEKNLRLRREELAAAGWNVDGSLIGWSTDLDDYQDEVARLTAAYEENQAALAGVTATAEEYAAAQQEATRGVQEIHDAIVDVSVRMGELAEAYNEAYIAAHESIIGQYELWDEAAEVAATSATSINSALESQITYWQDYNSNLAGLTERSADIEGLSEVISSFADGSADSVNAVAGMASATDEELAAMVANWQTLKAEQETVAGSLAEFETDFAASMAALEEELATTISDMDMSEAAAESGRNTIQGFISSAEGMLPAVMAAYGRIARAAATSLNAAARADVSYGIPGYAGGTTSAEPGLALVGENGPELIYFGGGEIVYAAEETMRMLASARAEGVGFGQETQRNTVVSSDIGGMGDSATVITLAPVYNITGASNPEQLMELLSSTNEDLRDFILAVLDEAGVDATRGAYR